MNLKFLEPAYIEYQEAIEFYNLQSEGLEKKLIFEIDKTITIIKKYPKSTRLQKVELLLNSQGNKTKRCIYGSGNSFG